MAYDEKLAERVRKALARERDVVEKRMMGGLSFMVRGTMVCSVSGRGGVLVRVGAEGRDRVLMEPHVRPMTMAGRTMAAFVRVEPEGCRTDPALARWIKRGLEFAATLPPKPVAARRRRR